MDERQPLSDGAVRSPHCITRPEVPDDEVRGGRGPTVRFRDLDPANHTMLLGAGRGTTGSSHTILPSSRRAVRVLEVVVGVGAHSDGDGGQRERVDGLRRRRLPVIQDRGWGNIKNCSTRTRQVVGNGNGRGSHVYVYMGEGGIESS